MSHAHHGWLRIFGVLGFSNPRAGSKTKGARRKAETIKRKEAPRKAAARGNCSTKRAKQPRGLINHVRRRHGRRALRGPSEGGGHAPPPLVVVGMENAFPTPKGHVPRTPPHYYCVPDRQPCTGERAPSPGGGPAVVAACQAASHAQAGSSSARTRPPFVTTMGGWAATRQCGDPVRGIWLDRPPPCLTPWVEDAPTPQGVSRRLLLI